MRVLHILSALALVGALGSAAVYRAKRSDSDSGKAPEPELSQKRDPKQRAPFTTTLATRFPLERERRAENSQELRTQAERLVDTLETSTDPSAIEAALRAVLSTYSSRSTLKATPDAKLDRALIQHLASKNPTLFRAALEAARVPLMTDDGPSPELAGAISELAAPDSPPPRRKLAIEALNQIRPSRRTEAILGTFEQALTAPEPELVSAALLALAESDPALGGLSLERRTKLTERVLALTSHTDPGVRGRALGVFASVPELGSKELRQQAGTRALRDPHGYVRGEAANLLSRAQDPKAIHALMRSIDDLTPAIYERAFNQLDGSQSTLIHDLAGRSRVADAALFAIHSLSRRLPLSQPLSLTLGRPPEPDAKVLENSARARAWYAAVARELP